MMDIPDDQLPHPENDSAGLFEDLPVATGPNEKSYRVLARKYRPQNFDDLIGQETMVRTLRNAFSMGRVAHAFMLTGVRGIGKTTTARIIARALNCVGIDGKGTAAADPCGVCPNCRAILADRHPDVLEIDAASHTGVDDVREIIEGSRFRPIQARMKVYIIDEVHMLSRNAFNALLKTLEEPPAQVTFIFATTEIRKVPVTVLSRCQRFDLRRVSQEQLSQHFLKIAEKEQVKISEAAVNLIARAADGSVRDGLSLLDQAIAQTVTQEDMNQNGENASGIIEAERVSEMLGFADKALVFDLFEAVMAGKPDQVLELTGQAYASGVDLGVLLTDLLELVHLLSRMQALPHLHESVELSELERVRGKKMADRLSVPVLGRAWQMLLKGIREVDTAPNRKAAAEMVLIRLCFVADMPSPEELVKQIANQSATHSANLSVNSSGERGMVSRSMPIGSETTHSVMNNSVSSSALPTSAPPTSTPMARNNTVISGQSVAYAMPATQVALSVVHEQGYETVPVIQQEKAVQERPVLWRSWRELLVFVKEQHAALLHAHLRNAVHLVKFAPPAIEIRVEENAPANLAQQLSKLLNEHSSTRWTVVLSRENGEPTLMEQETIQAKEDFAKAAADPLVAGILRIFPEAVLGKLVNPELDEYGLFPENNALFNQEDEPVSVHEDED